MKKKFKKLGKWIAFGYLVLIVLLVFLFALFLTGMITSEELVKNQYLMGLVALVATLFSLPGNLLAIGEFIVPESKKKNYSFLGKCPNCRQLIEVKMIED